MTIHPNTTVSVKSPLDNCSMSSNLADNPAQWYSYFVILLVCGMPLLLIGICTSLLSILMFIMDRFTPKTTKLLLKTLSMVDAIYLACVIGYVEFKVIYRIYPHTKPWLDFWESDQKAYATLIVVTNCCELFRNWGTVLIGIERYLVTCHPLQSSSWCTYKNTVCSLICCAVFTLVLRTPTVVRRITINSSDPYIRDRSKLADKIHNHIDALFLTLLPLVILAFCSFRITRALSHSKQLCNKSASSSHVNAEATIQHRRRTRVTRMLSMVLIIFFICGIPSLIYNSATYLVPDQCSLRRGVGPVLVSICWFMNIVFSTSNFFVYVIYMSKYRQILKNLLCCRFRETTQSDFTRSSMLPQHAAGTSLNAQNTVHRNRPSKTFEVNPTSSSLLMNASFESKKAFREPPSRRQSFVDKEESLPLNSSPRL